MAKKRIPLGTFELSGITRSTAQMLSSLLEAFPQDNEKNAQGGFTRAARHRRDGIAQQIEDAEAAAKKTATDAGAGPLDVAKASAEYVDLDESAFAILKAVCENNGVQQTSRSFSAKLDAIIDAPDVPAVN